MLPPKTAILRIDLAQEVFPVIAVNKNCVENLLYQQNREFVDDLVMLCLFGRVWYQSSECLCNCLLGC